MTIVTVTEATGTDQRSHSGARRMLMLGALGVVFGDIGTSCLYALQSTFSDRDGDIIPNPVDIYGVLSLVFWTLILIVSVEFVLLIMHADNGGEGGIMALIALVKRAPLQKPWTKPLLVTLGLFGVALFFGDGMITPAISVLSAVEGLEVASPSMAHLVIPIAVVVLVGLFLVQRFGTSLIGRVFGPVMVLWFAVIGLAGLAQVMKDPHILQAASPTYAVDFFIRHPSLSMVALGAVVLTITGTEALYADMGHFGRRAITQAWFWIVFPALLLNYAGQGSLLLQDSKAIANPFFLLFPTWAQLPMVVLATFATVIASQAVISGAFSVTNQAIRSGYLPRMNVRHTSNTEIGQVYAPAINWALLVAVLALVLVFRSSDALSSAYGIAVTGTLLIDTLLFLVVVRVLWHRPRWIIALMGIVFLTINALFLLANLPKVVSGGWFPLAVAAVVFVILTTWNRGRQRVTDRRLVDEGPISALLDQLPHLDPPLVTTPGTAVVLSLTGSEVPLAMKLSAEHMHSMHERVIVLTLQPTTAPHVPESERLSIEWVADSPVRIAVLRASIGFRDEVDAPATMQLAHDQGLIPDLDVDSLVYVTSHVDVMPDRTTGMARWRKRLFVMLNMNSRSPIEYFKLPGDRTVTIGTQVGF